MIDRSIQYMPVMMLKRDMSAYPVFKLCEGYTFDFYSPETGREDWVRVQIAADHIENEAEAYSKFDSEFLSKPELLPKRMLFARDASGAPVASATLWLGAPFGTEMQCLHWIATDKRHQGRGLCKAMLTRLMQLYAELNATGGIYLTSQTHSYAAIDIYERFGFERYMGPEPPNWHVDAFEETARRAWELIDAIRAQRRAKRS